MQARVLAATNKDLAHEVELGRFREDLYYRLNVVTIEIPPLRDRREDIPDLVEFLLAKHVAALGKRLSGVTHETMQLLRAAPWKGNVRELENVLQRAAILGDGPLITPHDLPPDLAPLENDPALVDDLGEATKRFERQHIERILRQTPDKKEAARRLGMGLSSLYRKIGELEYPFRTFFPLSRGKGASLHFSISPAGSEVGVRPMKTIIEPFKIKMVEPIKLTTPQEREEILRGAHFNVFQIPAERVIIDLLTDSGTSAMSSEQWAGMLRGDESYAGARSWYRFEKVLRDLTGMPHILPTHQGRASERLLFELVGGRGKVIPSNNHFDTTRANIEHSGAEAVDLVIDEGTQPRTRHPFKGNLDPRKLEALIAARRGPADPALHGHRDEQQRWRTTGEPGQPARGPRDLPAP